MTFATRVVDRGALFAGWIGLGVAVMVAIGLELILAIQSLVFLVTPICGLLIGYYANARSARRRPWGRVIANAAYAGLVTAVALSVIYGGIRLLFVYADTGFPDYNAPGRRTCETGPACTYLRYVDLGRRDELAARGITDAASFERAVLAEQLNGALLLIGATMVSALAGGLIYGATAGGPPVRPPEPAAGEGSV